MLLNNLFITYLRQLGLFNSAALDAHQEKYCPGTYPLYILQTRERYKKLAGLVFQADAHLALAYGQPPMLHRREIDVELAVSFGLWNAFGINVCIKRLSEEPVGRSTTTISEMTKKADAFRRSPLLIEDVHLGLCGLLQTVWVLAESSSSKEGQSLCINPYDALIIENLDSWKRELDRINELINSSAIKAEASRYLLVAYRGEDESTVTSLERVQTLFQDLIVFYYFLRFHTFSCLHASSQDGSGGQLDVPMWQTSDDSKYGREALLCTTRLLRIAEERESSTTYHNPLVQHALIAGAKMTKKLVSERQRDCHVEENHISTNFNAQRQSEQDGTVSIDDMRVCICNIDTWLARFEKVLERVK